MKLEILYTRNGYGIIKGDIRDFPDSLGEELIEKGLAKPSSNTSKSKKKSRKDTDYDINEGTDIKS